MGLDVYLIEKEKELRDKEREDAWEALWARKESGEIDEDEYKRLNAELPGYESHPYVPSEKYGLEKLFNRRYLRSSYNDGGFNRAVPEIIGEPDHDLYWVFEDLVSNDEYTIKLTPESIPGLRNAKNRALALAEGLRTAELPLRVHTFPAYNSFAGQDRTDSDQALAWYREQLKRETSFGGGWSNKQGTFFGPPGDGIEVLALVCGTDVLGTPCLHAIAQPQEAVEHYAESAEITSEFCDEAIMLVERDGEAYIHWSS
jgi:hypothetical protein